VKTGRLVFVKIWKSSVYLIFYCDTVKAILFAWVGYLSQSLFGLAFRALLMASSPCLCDF